MTLHFKTLAEIPKDSVIELMNHPKVRKHMPLLIGTFDTAKYKSFIAAKEIIWKEKGYGPWAFTWDSTFMGWGGLQPVEDDVEIALVLHPNYWGKGKLIYDKLIEEAFHNRDLKSVILLLPPSRTRTKGILNLGFKPDGEYVFLKKRYLRYRLSNPQLSKKSEKKYLRNEVQASYAKLTLLLNNLPKDLLTIKAISFLNTEVSIADLVSYQIGWGKRLLHWYESGRNGTTITMPGEGFSKWDYKGIAHHFFRKYHFDGHTSQQAYFKATVEEILEVIQREAQLENLDKIGVWEWCTLASGKKWPLSKWIVVNTCSPYKRAYFLIKKFLKTL